MQEPEGYNKTNWAKGAILTAGKLNNIEKGIDLATQAARTALTAVVPINDEEGNVDNALKETPTSTKIASTKYVEGYVSKIIEGLDANIQNGSATQTLTSITQTDGKISAAFQNIATAAANQLGLVKIGNGLSIDNNGSVSVAPIYWSNVQGKPTTLSDYGITDAAEKNHNHNGVYAIEGHNHNSAYAALNHTHEYLPLSGGTLTGTLTLSGAPASDLHAATKKYVDDSLRMDNIIDVQLSSGRLDGNAYANPSDTGDNILITLATLSEMINYYPEDTTTTPTTPESVSILGVNFTATELQALKALVSQQGGE